jgi:NitT/TauT family transport system substrate-binding protein
MKNRLFVSTMTSLILTLFSVSTFATTLALNWKPEPQFGGFYQALIDGSFENEKLKVDIIIGGSGTPTIQMVASGKVDYGIVSADEVLISRQHGSDIVALFAVYQTNPQCIITHAEKQFKSLEDVYNADGILAQQAGLPYAQFLKNKFPKAKVKIVPYLGGITNFIADKNYAQQGFLTSEPLMAEKAGQKVKSFLVADSGYNPYTTVLVIKKSRFLKNPTEVESMVRAVRNGWNHYLENPTKANAHMQKLNPSMDKETFEASAKAQVPLIKANLNDKNLGMMIEERWKTLESQMIGLGILKNTQPNIKDLFLTQ